MLKVLPHPQAISTSLPSGLKSGLKSGLRNKALALAAGLALIPAIANAKTSTATGEATATETSVQASTSQTSDNERTYVITTYAPKNYFDKGLAHNVNGNQFGLNIGADYNYNAIDQKQQVGPDVSIAGRFGNHGHNLIFDADIKAGFDIPSKVEGSTTATVSSSLLLGYEGYFVKGRKGHLGLRVAGEGFAVTDVNKDFNFRRPVNNCVGAGVNVGVSGQCGIGNSTRLTATVHGAMGAKKNCNQEIIMTSATEGNLVRPVSPYARYGGDITFDIGVISIGAYGGCFYNLNSDLSISDTSWGGGAKVAFRFGN